MNAWCGVAVSGLFILTLGMAAPALAQASPPGEYMCSRLSATGGVHEIRYIVVDGSWHTTR